MSRSGDGSANDCSCQWHRGCSELEPEDRSHAGEGHARARPPRQESRQGSDDAGGRIRAGRDPPHPRRQTRSAIGQAGDRHRVVEGATCGREAWSAAADGHCTDEACRGLRDARRASTSAPFGQPISRGPQSAPARRARSRFATGTGAAGQERCAAAQVSGSSDRESARRPCARRLDRGLHRGRQSKWSRR